MTIRQYPSRIRRPSPNTASLNITTEEYLLNRFGPLMSIPGIATLLGRSPDGVRVSLYSDTDISQKLKPAMIQIGRRVFFRTMQINDALNLDIEVGPQDRLQ